MEDVPWKYQMCLDLFTKTQVIILADINWEFTMCQTYSKHLTVWSTSYLVIYLIFRARYWYQLQSPWSAGRWVTVRSRAGGAFNIFFCSSFFLDVNWLVEHHSLGTMQVMHMEKEKGEELEFIKPACARHGAPFFTHVVICHIDDNPVR